MLFGVLAFSGMCGAASTSLALTVPVTPDVNDTTSRWEYRVTTTYDAASNRYFTGAVEAGAGEYAITMFTTTDGSDLIKTGLTPVSIYAVNGESDLVANPLYNAKVWEIDFFISGANTYVAAIMQLAGESGVGGSVVAVINTADPKETYISGAAMSLDGESAGTANTASRFVKLVSGQTGADATISMVFAAVADPTTGEFDTSKSTVGIRGYVIPTTPEDNSLTELDMLGGTGKGVKLGSTAAMMSVKMRKLTSMKFDSFSKALYLGGYMSDDTLGLCGFYLSGTNVFTTLNNTTGGTLLNSSTATGFADLSRIHHISIQNDGTRSHLILQAGSSSKDRTNFYALSTSTGAAGTKGKLAQGTATTVATARSQLWMAIGANGVYSTPARAVVGNAPFPLAPAAVVTKVAMVGNVFYVATWNAATGNSDVWKATATLSSNYIASWSAWQNFANTALNNVTGFATNATYAWAVLDRYSVYVNSAIGSAAAVVQPSLGLANIKDPSERTRLRKIVRYDETNRQVILAAPTTPDNTSMYASENYTVATGARAVSAEVAALSSLITGTAVWDVAVSSTGDRYYLLNVIPDTTFTGTTGGQVIVKVPADGSTPTSISSAGLSTPNNTQRVAFFKDGNGTPAVSRCIKMVPGTNPATGLPVLFCLIPDAADVDVNYFQGNSSYDLVKVLNADLTDPSKSITYQSVIDGTTGHHMSGNISGLQCAYWDSTLARLYLGGRKSSGQDPALSILSLDSGSMTGSCAFASGNGTALSIRDVYQLSSMHLSTDTTTTIRSILLVGGGRTGDHTSDAGAYVSALPLVRYGSSKGNVATINALNTALDYTITATTTDLTWSVSTNAHLFNVGGTAPWNTQAALIEMKVVDKTLFVTIANPPGITGQSGVFSTTAVVDSTGTLVAWTPWAPVASLTGSMQNVVFDPTSAQVLGLDLASGRLAVPAWKAPGSASSFDKLVKALNNDFADKGGVYNLASHKMVEGILHNNNVGTGVSANLIVATGNKKVALGHVHYKTSGGVSSQYNPDASNVYGYKLFSNDAALSALGNIYCSTASSGSSGWIFVGGEAGVAVLRVPGTGSNAGKGWSESVPSTLLDTTSTGSGLADMTWFNLPGITGPIYQMTTVYDAFGHGESLIAIGKGGVYAVRLAASKFTDAAAGTDISVDSVSVLSATAGASERMWCVEPLYRGMGTFAVGTTLGMYVVRYPATGLAPTVLAEVVDGDSNSLGPVASIVATRPIVTASNNPRYTIDCVTAAARTDVSKHYRVNVSFVYSSGAVSGTYVPSLIGTLDRMTTQILNNAAVDTYVAGVPNRLPASLKVLSTTLEGSADPVVNGLTAPSMASSIGRTAVVGCDGSKLVTVDGRVYVQSV